MRCQAIVTSRALKIRSRLSPWSKRCQRLAQRGRAFCYQHPRAGGYDSKPIYCRGRAARALRVPLEGWICSLCKRQVSVVV